MKDFKNPKILRLAKRIVKKVSVCNNCLGREFAYVSTGMTNKERGKIIRKLLKREKEPPACSICNDLFKNLENYAHKALEKVKSIEFSSFLVGSILSSELIQKEEDLWEEAGIDYCEPLKSELNRELGKILHKKLKRKVDEKNPDIVILFNLQKDTVELQIRPLFIYGKYQKLVRGIPQTKWDTYPVTVEDIIAKPLMRETKASAHAMHGAGREDVDARCLDWRPFVFELNSPQKRTILLKGIEKEINKSKKVKVSGLRLTNRKEVIRVKSIRPDKTYRVLINVENKIKKDNLASLKKLVGIIHQKTPSRVLHRRADLVRRRRVKKIQATLLSSKKALLEIRGEAGLYIKELITGDKGRTSPSVAEILGSVQVKELDVIKIHLGRKDH